MRMVWQAFKVAKVLDHDGLVIVTGTFPYRDMRLLVPPNVACQEVGRLVFLVILLEYLLPLRCSK
jgi:hypothetical protein